MNIIIIGNNNTVNPNSGSNSDSNRNPKQPFDWKKLIMSFMTVLISLIPVFFHVQL